jgi:cytochrome b561
MVDINVREGGVGVGPVQPRPGGRQTAAQPARRRPGGPPRSDIGTILLHWATAIAFFVNVFTGVRIAADDPGAVVSKWLAPILPQGEVWTWHFLSGLALFFCSFAYLFYILRSGLVPRLALKKLRAFLVPQAGTLRYDAFNVVLHWLLYGLMIVLVVTGVLLYLGYGGLVVTIHLVAAFGAIAYTFAHLLSHYLYGGLQQWLRLFRPAALIANRATRPWPLVIGLAAGAAVTVALAAVDWGSRDTLVIRRVATAPTPARLLDDPVWASLRPVRIRTQQGINLGGSGESLVEVRAVHDGQRAYFAFRWEDPSRSLRRNPLIKRQDGWHIMADNPYIDDVTTFYEDKFSVIFSPTAAFGSGAAAHFGDKPLADKPGSRNGRGLHYTDGAMIDMWQWKPSRGGMLGYVDDMYIGAPTEPTPDQASQLARYQAGYWGDPGNAFYVYNFLPLKPQDYHGGPVPIRRLPKDLAAVTKAMGHWDPDPDASVDDGSKWWMFENETVPYSAEEDAKVPVGTILPGVLIIGDYTGDRAQVRGTAHWQDGHWTLIASRDLRTGSKYDQDFVPGRELYMWVAVFDHTQTRHTRHPRPVRVTVAD